MSNPFDIPAEPIFPITEPQAKFLRSLLMEKAQMKGMDLAAATESLDRWIPKLSKVEASTQIDKALRANAALREEINVAKAKQAVADVQADDIDGFWELPGERICKVQIAVHGSGNPYAKLLNPETGKFNFAPGLITEVRTHGTRLSLDRAKELGKLYGVCIRCGRTLTDEESITAGIGPICAGKWS